MPRNHYDLGALIDLANLGQCLETVHARHFDIEKDEVRMELCVSPQRGIARVLRADFDTLVFENLAQRFTNTFFVVDD